MRLLAPAGADVSRLPRATILFPLTIGAAVRRHLGAWVAALAFLCASAGAARAASDRSLEARTREIKERIMPAVAALRGLAYKKAVPVDVVTPARLAAYIRKSVDENMTEEEFTGYEKMLEYLGLIAPGTDLKETIIKAYSQEVAGFYDDEEKSFSIVEDPKMPAHVDSVTIAHELTHALQDQWFGLSSMNDYGEHDDDVGLALGALAEGDASEIMFRYATKAPPRGQGPARDYTQFLSLSLGPEMIPGLPLILTQDMIFPYTYGTRFVMALLDKGGPDAVNLAFKDPPISTQQVITPEKYFKHVEPYVFDLPDVTAMLPPGWKRVDQEPLGQFELGIYMSVTSGEWGVEAAIADWRGDMLAGYSGPRKDDFCVIYKSTWNTCQGAQAFAARYAQLIEARFHEAKRTYAVPDRTIWTRGERLYYLGRSGGDVLVVENVPRAAAAEVILAAWDAPKTPVGVLRPVADRDRVQPAGTIGSKPAKHAGDKKKPSDDKSARAAGRVRAGE